MQRLFGLCASLVAAALPLLAAPAVAQDYPARPIRVIATSSAGGTSDIFMRALAEELHKRLGQPFIVENRPGGAFNIGARACAEAPPDGYTLCIIPGEPLVFNQFLFKTLAFDPENGFEPITQLFFITQALVVSGSLNVKTLPDLIALSKAKPGTLSYSTAAVPLGVFIERWKRDTGADLVRVPFRGGGEAVNGMLTGTTPVAFFGLGNLIAYLRAGTIKGIAVDAGTRSPLFPGIPTLKEVAATEDVTQADFAIWAPKGTPKALIQKVCDDIAAIGNEPSFRDKFLVQRGLDPQFSTPDSFAAYLQKSRTIAEATAKKGNLQPQ
jgi:tripartite-type tricarboxylate transporter receptor subunit TctC